MGPALNHRTVRENMGDVVKFRRPRNGTIKGVARGMLSEAMRSIGGKPDAVVLVALGTDGQFAVRMCNYETMQDFDAYARAAAAIGRSRDQLLEEE